MKRCVFLLLIMIVLGSLLSAAGEETEYAAGSSLPLAAGTGTWTDSSYYLADDITCGAVTVSGSVTLDLNGHTLDLSKITLAANASLSVFDGSEAQTGRIYSDDTVTAVIEGGNGSMLTVSSGEIAAGGSAHTVKLTGTASMLLAGGTVSNAASASGSAFYSAINLAGSASFEMRGGGILCTGANSKGIYIQSTGTCTITEGSITAVYAGVHLNNSDSCVLTISGGTLTGGYTGLLIHGTVPQVHLTGGVYTQTEANSKGPILTGPNRIDKYTDDGYGYYLDAEANTAAIYTSDKKYFKTGPYTVYVCQIPAEWTICVTAGGQTYITEILRDGQSLLLPASLTAPDGTVNLVDHYTDGSRVLHPGDTITAERDTELTAVFLATYTVDYISAGGQRLGSEAVLQNTALLLPASFTAADGTVYTAVSYSWAGGTAAPGDEIMLSESSVITVNTLTHSCAGITFDIPVNAAGATSLPSGTCYLENDITYTTLTVTGHVQLCLNGHTMTVNQIRLTEGSILSVYDCTDGQQGMICSAAASPAVVFSGPGAALTVYGGTLRSASQTCVDTGGKADSSITLQGGRISSGSTAVSVTGTNAVLAVHAGEIVTDAGSSKCTAAAASGGSIRMDGGMIRQEGSANTVNLTGDSSMLLAGGTIKSAASSETAYYSAINLAGSASFEMQGGGILCTGTRSKGINIQTTGTCTITEGSITAVYAGVHLNNSDSCVLTISGGTLTGEYTGLLITSPLGGEPQVHLTGGVYTQTGTASKGPILSGPNRLDKYTDEGYGYYLDPEANTAASVPSTNKFFVENRAFTVYVCGIPSVWNVSIVNEDRGISQTIPVRDGQSFALPSVLTAVDGTVYTAASYSWGDRSALPGEELVVSGDMVLAVSTAVHTCSDTVFDIPVSTARNALSGSAYYLENDVSFSGTISVSGNVMLCLNGHTLDSAIRLEADACLTVCDCSREQTGLIRSGKNVVTLGSGSRFTMTGGSIAAASTAYAVYIPSDASAACMTASNCRIVSDSKAAVYVQGAEAFLEFGSCTIGLLNESSAGGGIDLAGTAAGSTLTLTGCRIEAGSLPAIHAVDIQLTMENTDAGNHYAPTSQTDYKKVAVIALEGTATRSVINGGTVTCAGSSHYAVQQKGGTISMEGTTLTDTANKLNETTSSPPGATLELQDTAAVLTNVIVTSQESDAISLKGASSARLLDCTAIASRSLNDRIRSALTTGDATVSVYIENGQYNGNSSGYAISNRTELTIAGAPEISGGRCGIFNKGANAKLIITGDPTVTATGFTPDIDEQDMLATEVKIDQVSAICLKAGTASIGGGSFRGSLYGIYIGKASAVLSGGVYICEEDGVSPVCAVDKNASAYLDGTIEGLAYYTRRTGSSTFDAEVRQLDKDTSLTAWVRTGCGHPDWNWTAEAPYNGLCTQCGEVLVHMIGNQMSISETLSMTYWLEKDIPEAVDGTWAMHFTRMHSSNDTSYESVTAGSEYSDSIRTFTYYGINPQCMTTDIVAELTYVKAGCSDKTLVLTDTVQAYCIRAFRYAGTTAIQKELMANLLNYGAAAQQYQNWKKDTPANGGAAASYVSEYSTAPVQPDHTDSTYQHGSIFTGCTVRWSYKTQLSFGAALPSGTGSGYMVVYDGTAEKARADLPAGGARVYVDVAPQYYGTVYTCVVYDAGGAELGRMNYSVNSYIYSGWNYIGSGLRNLLHAMQAFGATAREAARK